MPQFLPFRGLKQHLERLATDRGPRMVTVFFFDWSVS